jgi:hypothetical protein
MMKKVVRVFIRSGPIPPLGLKSFAILYLAFAFGFGFGF